MLREPSTQMRGREEVAAMMFVKKDVSNISINLALMHQQCIGTR